MNKTKIKGMLFSDVSCIAALCAVCVVVLGFGSYEDIANSSLIPVLNITVIASALLSVLIMKLRGKITEDKAVTLIMLCGFALRLSYVIYTGVHERQHDVESFGSGMGHSGYIEYFFNNHRLPSFDPRLIWQFYHPPFHHAISAFWLSIQTFIGISYNNALEGLQILTLFYSYLCMVVCKSLFASLKLKGIAMYAAMALICFHPSFIIMSGSVNNDMLSVLFMLAAVLCTVKWYSHPTMLSIIKIAVCIGLGMSTKLSCAIIAPGVALVFLFKLIKSELKRVKIIKQFIIFGVICIPLGLWWSVRNYLMFDVPFGYVPGFDEGSWQYIGEVPLIRRLLDFSLYQFKSLYMAWDTELFCVSPYLEFNPTIGILKTSVFGEYVLSTDVDYFTFFANILFYSNILLAVIAILGIISFLFNTDSFKKPFELIYLLISSFAVLVSYYVFCINYPHTCTMNVRYAMLLLPVSAIFSGILIKRLYSSGKKSGKIIFLILSSVVVAFCLSSAVVYTALYNI